MQFIDNVSDFAVWIHEPLIFFDSIAIKLNDINRFELYERGESLYNHATYVFMK